MTTHIQWFRRPLLVVSALLFVCICYGLWSSPRLAPVQQHEQQPQLGLPNGVASASRKARKLPCRTLQGANETVVILKTGSTEIEEKLPMHLATTLRCYPNRLLFSDHAEIYHGETILDALETVSPHYKENHADFELYRQLRDQGRSILTSNEKQSSLENQESRSGHQENPGWKLDKWKFLPMVNRTLQEFPDMKWYVFIEADTFILWSSLLAYLATLNHSELYYLGTPVWTDGVPFAHGGSGFVVSQTAMRLVVDWMNSHQEELESYTEEHWAGDSVLGKVFGDVGMHRTDSWPVFQGDYTGIVPYLGPDGRPMPISDRRIWCSPTVSYHHMQPSMVADFWRFEQQWLSHTDEVRPQLLLHRDIFRRYIMPQLQDARDEWNNESENDVGYAGTLDICRSWCVSAEKCVQYSLDREGQCKHFHLPRLGKPGKGAKSGWLVDRVERLAAGVEPCG